MKFEDIQVGDLIRAISKEDQESQVQGRVTQKFERSIIVGGRQLSKNYCTFELLDRHEVKLPTGEYAVVAHTGDRLNEMNMYVRRAGEWRDDSDRPVTEDVVRTLIIRNNFEVIFTGIED